jgi:hypothetical protein
MLIKIGLNSQEMRNDQINQDNVANPTKTQGIFLAYRHPKGSLENSIQVGMEFVKCI